MSTKNKLKIPFWIARVWSLLALAFLVIMLGAHVVEAIQLDKPFFGAMSSDEFVSFMFFPLGMILSLIIVQFYHKVGGYFCVLCMLGFLITRPDLIMSPMIYLFGFPGVLFLLYSYLIPNDEVSYN